MYVVIIGCGRLGSELAYRLFKRGHEISVVDEVAAAFDELPTDFIGRIIEGDALNQDVLHRAGIERADAVAVVTNKDTLNLVVGRVASELYHVANVILRNYHPDTFSLFDAFGLQVVSSTSWGAQRIEEMLYHSDIRTVFSAGNGEVEVYEITVSKEWGGKKIQDLIPCSDCMLIALSRSGRAFMPDKNETLNVGDILDIGATFEGIEALREKMRKPVKEG